MKFNHISFPSCDVDATASFFVRHLGCTASAFGTTQILKRHDFDIVVEDAEDRVVHWPENFHIGFELPSAADVLALYEAFKAAGVVFETEVIQHVRGSRFFCQIPGGVGVEINTREDAAEAFRASFGRA
ncbi:VOC family protein [Dyella telluris]|uniref:VOC family protein n=2 Tax=Dyella telluris TaxID=2763498 RepID=A0A7G8QAT9_9GAMM|nr:VOC family protein [Dyella telluris]